MVHHLVCMGAESQLDNLGTYSTPFLSYGDEYEKIEKTEVSQRKSFPD